MEGEGANSMQDEGIRAVAYLTILIIYWLKPANMMEKPVKSSDRES